MRPTSVLGEAWRNLTSGTTRAVLGTLALTLVLIGTLAVDGLAVRAVLTDQRALLASGGATLTVSATGQILPDRCLALNEVDGVRGAFALRAIPAGRAPAALPDSVAPLFDVAGDVSATLGGAPIDRGGVLLSEEFAAQLGIEPGDRLALVGEPSGATLAGTFSSPDDGRASTLSAAILKPAQPTDAYDSCWLTVWPPDPDLEALTTSVVDPAAEPGAVTTRRLNQSAGPPRATDAVLEDRPTLVLPMFGAALAFAVGFALVRRRRLELATARHLGQTAVSLNLQVVIESVVWVGAAGLVGAALLLPALTAGLTADEVRWTLAGTGLHLLGIAFAAIAGALAAAAGISPRRMHLWSRDR